MSFKIFLAILTTAFFTTSAAAEAVDPCDFVSTGETGFGWQQVMDCYKSVPFVRSDLEQIVAVLRENREFSDLSELFDQRYGWKANLDALLEKNFPNDFEMHNALRAEHIAMQDPHIAYQGPTCYNDLVAAFIPFDFGSTLWPPGEADAEKRNQIIFIEGAPFKPHLYERYTGIHPDDFVGSKVLKIDHVPALKFFRDFGRERVSFGSFDSSNLMNIINRRALFSVRGNYFLGGAAQPRKPFVEMKLKRRNGEVITVKFPWLYADRRALGIGRRTPLTRSTTEFQALCLQRPGSGSAASADLSVEAEMPLAYDVTEDHKPVIEMSNDDKATKVEHAKNGEASFYEVPPEELDRDVQIIAAYGFSRGLQYKDDTTVLRLGDTRPFYLTARETIAYACAHSTRLIIDVRSGNGGDDAPTLWLYRHLFDDGGAPIEESGKAAFRMRIDPELQNRVLRFAGLYGLFAVETLGASPDFCDVLPEQQCFQDLETKEQGLIPHTEVDWFENSSVTEVRGGTPVPLTRKIAIGESVHLSRYGYPRPTDVSSCQNKFSGDNLIILTDGANCSGSYLLLEPFIDNHKATVVTMGGYVADPDDEIEVGICRTGGSFYIDQARQWVDLIEAWTEGELTLERPRPTLLARAVTSYMEVTGYYRGSSDNLHWNAPMTYDVRLNVWSDSPETDGYVYGKVIEAVEAHADD